MKNKRKNIITFIIAFIIIILFITFFISNTLYKFALKKNSDKGKLFDAPHNSMGERTVNKELENSRQKTEKWFEQSNYKDKYIESYDKLKLHATEIKNTSDKWIIICHGYVSKGTSMISIAEKFHNEGYNILLPDFRGHGESEGNYIGMGWHDRLDIVSWIDYITYEYDDPQIVLYGVSMGGAAVMMTSGEDLPNNVKAIVEDCGYTSLWDEFSYQLKQLYKLPDFPLMYTSSIITKIRSGFWFSEADAIKQVSKSKTPMLFIHGDNDTFVPSHMLDSVYEAANVPKEKLFVEGAGHGGAAEIAGDIYWQTIFDFLSKYID